MPDGNRSIHNIEKEDRIVAELFDECALADLNDIQVVISYLKGKRAEREQHKLSDGGQEYFFKGEFRKPPDEAPAMWPGGNNTPESIISFIERNYSEWIGFGMTRAHLDKLDDSALAALRAWERINGKCSVIPTSKQHNDAMLRWKKSVDRETFTRVLPKFEVRRLDKLESSRANPALEVT